MIKHLTCIIYLNYRLAKSAEIKTTAKLFYRRGLCYMKSSDFQRARQDFHMVSDLDPSIKGELDKIMKELTDLQKKQDEKSKNMFQKFFK